MIATVSLRYRWLGKFAEEIATSASGDAVDKRIYDTERTERESQNMQLDRGMCVLGKVCKYVRWGDTQLPIVWGIWGI